MTPRRCGPTLATYLDRWDLVPDGEPLTTPSSNLIPVYRGETPMMLKIPSAREEKDGCRLMVWWAGRGAARVFEHDDNAILLERATGPDSLRTMVVSGIGSADWIRQDTRATATICAAARTLHTVQAVEPTPPPSGLVPLGLWFTPLLIRERTDHGFLRRSATLARDLLADQQDVVVLHGDLHHGNVLDFSTGHGPDWRAIDPKFIVGERAYDFANILCNPSTPVATAPGRLARQIAVVSEHAAIDHDHLLRWLIAYAGLSVSWYDNTPTDPTIADMRASTLQVGRMAEGLLGLR